VAEDCIRGISTTGAGNEDDEKVWTQCAGNVIDYPKHKVTHARSRTEV